MDKDILIEVVEAEKEIQRCIESEQARLQEWLAKVRHEAEESVAREEQTTRASMTSALDAAKSAAEERANRVVSDAAAHAGRIQSLDDGTLTGIILKRLSRILLE